MTKFGLILISLALPFTALSPAMADGWGPADMLVAEISLVDADTLSISLSDKHGSSCTLNSMGINIHAVPDKGYSDSAFRGRTPPIQTPQVWQTYESTFSRSDFVHSAEAYAGTWFNVSTHECGWNGGDYSALSVAKALERLTVGETAVFRMGALLAG